MLIRNQKGIVLIVALIMLVIMTLGAIALVRSMDTTTLIAGNLAFRQSATYSGDLGIEQAVTRLQGFSTIQLTCNPVCPSGYMAAGVSAAPDIATPSGSTCNAGYQLVNGACIQTWESYWANTLNAQSFTIPTGNANNADTAGNTVSYVIHRLCAGSGERTAIGTNCIATPAAVDSEGCGLGEDKPPCPASPQIYYRITARVSGLKNSVSFVQAIVAW